MKHFQRHTLSEIQALSLQHFEQISTRILFQITNNRFSLRKLLLEVPENATLFSQCIHYDAVDKIVLWDSFDQKIQLRLHIYSSLDDKTISSTQIDTEDPHNHRWNFTSLILSGGYQHTIYKEDFLTHRLTPIMIRRERLGDCYTLHHSQFHSIVREPNTVTILFRGPQEKDRFQTIKGDSCALKRDAFEDPAFKKQRALGRKEFDLLLERLKTLQII